MKRFEFLLHLVEIGVKPKHAIEIAKQTPIENRHEYVTLYDAVVSFKAWDETKEGFTYWVKVHDEYLAKQD